MKRLTLFLLLITTSWLPPSLAQADKPVAPEQVPGVTRLNAEQVIELILSKPELLIIDVRIKDEYDKGHIQGAINLLDTELTADTLAQQAGDQQRPLLFYCNGERCKRSANASRKAQDWGYPEIYWFRGGWVEWRRKNYPVTH